MSTGATIAVSIIVPSHNRQARLLSALDAIARQRFALETVETIVVADGCVDGTAAAVQALEMPFGLRVLELPGVGPALARNRGAELARAPLLVFLDDDVEPLAGWLAAHVAAHVAAHHRREGAVVIGSYPPVPVGDSEFRTHIRNWWMAMFDRLEEPGHRFTFEDILTGNFSMGAEHWHSLGGLDPAFARAREDGELGIRLIAAGMSIVHAPGAFAWHHEYETLTLPGALRRKVEEGRSDVRLGRKHPGVIGNLPIARYGALGRTRGRLLRIAFRRPVAGRTLARAAGWLAERCSAMLIGPVFRGAFGLAQMIAYIRGAADELQTLDAWRSFATEHPATRRKVVSIDLMDGLSAAQAKLDTTRPDEARIMYGATEIGLLPYAPGAEPWGGRHLLQHLKRECATSLLLALHQKSTLMPGGPDDGVAEPSADAKRFIGQRSYERAVAEATLQWSRHAL